MRNALRLWLNARNQGAFTSSVKEAPMGGGPVTR